MHFELSPLIVRIDFCIVNTYSEFQVNIFTNKQDITKYHKFLHDDDKAIAIPQVFSKNS